MIVTIVTLVGHPLTPLRALTPKIALPTPTLVRAKLLLLLPLTVTGYIDDGCPALAAVTTAASAQVRTTGKHSDTPTPLVVAQRSQRSDRSRPVSSRSGLGILLPTAAGMIDAWTEHY